MRKILTLWLVLLFGLTAFGLDILSHYSNYEEAGVSVEQDFIKTDHFKLGVGLEWNEMIDSSIRTFPVYVVGRVYTQCSAYAIMRAGATLNRDIDYDSKFLESGIGIMFGEYTVETLVTHTRGINQFAVKMRYVLF